MSIGNVSFGNVSSFWTQIRLILLKIIHPTEDIHEKTLSREKVLTLQKLVRIFKKKFRILSPDKF